MDNKKYKWAIIENICTIAAIAIMYCLWHTAWPFLLLLNLNFRKPKKKEG